jgi:hypothetical protein
MSVRLSRFEIAFMSLMGPGCVKTLYFIMIGVIPAV